MKAIFQFEDQKIIADRFRITFLEQALTKAGLLTETKIEFQDYLDRSKSEHPLFKPAQVASQAFKKWDTLKPVPEKTVWVLDLSAAPPQNTPDPSYGLCVLIALANEFGGSIEDFLNKDSFLTVMFTHYPADLRKDDGISLLPQSSCDLRALDALWPRVKKIVKEIRNENPSRVATQEIERALVAVNQQGPRFILANSSNDDVWLAELIVNWLK
jgi:hypothetical protein